MRFYDDFKRQPAMILTTLGVALVVLATAIALVPAYATAFGLTLGLVAVYFFVLARGASEDERDGAP